MVSISRICPREDGLGWKLIKFHELMHLTEYIQLYGSPANYNTGFCESNHKWISKNPAKNTQRIKSKFEKQVADRVVENVVLDMLHVIVENSFFDDEKKVIQIIIPPRAKGCKMTLHLTNHNNDFQNISLKCISRSPNKNEFGVGMMNVLADQMIQWNVNKLDVYSEYEHCNNLTFRSHSNYRQFGPWRDWVMINFGDHGMFPALLFGFIINPYDINDIKVVFQTTKTECKQSSMLTKTYILEMDPITNQPLYRIESVKVLDHVCWCMTYGGMSQHVLLFHDATKWGSFMRHCGTMSFLGSAHHFVKDTN